LPLDLEPHPRAFYALSSNAAVAALSQLRQQAIPAHVEPPRFGIPHGQTLPGASWLDRLVRQFTRQMVAAAALAAIVVVLATTLPAWAAIQRSSTAPVAHPVHSSAGVTGSAATRVEDLSVTTFVGGIPFLQQLRYHDAVTGSIPEGRRFIEGAREATLAEYIQDIGVQVTFPYLSDVLTTKQAIQRWTAAVEEHRRLEAERLASEAARAAAAAAPVRPAAVWQGPPVSGGTRIAGASITFYSCIGNGFCGNMASGQAPFAGAAACSYNLPFGTRFIVANDPLQRVFVCLDRGALAPTWVDVWFYDAADGWAWPSIVGTRSDIIIVQ
jgi:hypothetical protein